MEPKASVILRYSNRSKQRAQNLRTIIRHISHNPNVEIIVSAMEKDINLKELNKLKQGLANRAKLIHIYSPKPFASTTANNLGAAKANTDIFIFQDADILFANSAYNKIINLIQAGKESVRVGEECLNLNHSNTKKLHTRYAKEKWSLAPVQEFLKLKKRLGKKGSRDAPGAATALSRQAFLNIGGWCELFQVYGWEDCYFRFKVRKLNHVSLNMPMIHMAHEVNYQSGHQKVNNGLYSQIISANKEKYKNIIRRDREALLNKYPNLQKQS